MLTNEDSGNVRCETLEVAFSASAEFNLYRTRSKRKILEWVAQVLNASTREAALLELSKKREQVQELALILWHSFGERGRLAKISENTLTGRRRYDVLVARDNLGLSAT